MITRILAISLVISGCTQVSSNSVDKIFVEDSCPAPELVDLTGQGFGDPTTRAAMERAVVVCRERYQGCVSKFTRTGELNYHVLCRSDSDATDIGDWEFH